MKRDEKKVDYCLNHISGGKDSFEDLKNRIYEYINPEPDKGSDYLVDYLVRVLLFCSRYMFMTVSELWGYP